MVVCLGIVYGQLDAAGGRKVLGIVNSALTLGLTIACAYRGLRRPEERATWWMLSLAWLLAQAFNILFAFYASPGRPLKGPYLLMSALQVVIGICVAWGVLLGPWRSHRREERTIQVLGALLFGGSFALLLWLLGTWQAASRFQNFEQGLLAAICTRYAVINGVLVYLMVEDPRRIRGPLLLMLISIAAASLIAIFVLKGIASAPTLPVPGIAAFIHLGHVLFLLAVMDLHPLEAEQDAPPLRIPFLDGLIYLPYMAAAGCLAWTVMRSTQDLLVPMLGFLAVTTLLVIHQFALLREVRDARDHLEHRVEERTHALEEAQAIMLRTERMNSLGLMGAGLAHDLNNALTAISASVSLIRDSMGRKASVEEEDLARIEAASQHSAALSHRLMAFARRESEVEEVLDLSLIVSEDRELLRMVLPARIQLDIDPGLGPTEIVASRGQVQQALVNLVGNARDAIAGAGFIRISVGRDLFEDQRPCASLEVADSGTGMPPEVMEKLFQPLFTTKAPGKGTGLGLASVKAVMERLGGTVGVRSAPGAGTTFTLRFPLRT